MSDGRLRDLYASYVRGEIPFEDVIEASERFIEQFERERVERAAEAPREPPEAGGSSADG